MKKFLSLVMALVMTMSLVTIGAGATEYKDLTDKDEIQYAEAVTVLNKLGIISGYEDGSFRPTGALTRGAAAKIIVSLIQGADFANALTVTAAPYSDVPVTNTFAAVISYCKTAGYINGYTDGTFRPAAALTGYAFSKMLLGALGYKSEYEGFTGAGWTMNVAALGSTAGLFNDFLGDGFKGNDGVDRQSACLLALNTLKATEVKYVGGTSISSTTGDLTTNIQQKPTREYVTSNNKAINANIYGQDGNTGNNSQFLTLQFGEDHFRDLKLTNEGTARDDFGRPSNKWSYKSVVIGTYAKVADYTYTAGASGDTAADKVKDMGLKDFKVTPSYYTENGQTITFTGSTSQAKLEQLADKIASNGTLIQVYLDENDADTIEEVVVVRTQLMQVNSVKTNSVSLKIIDEQQDGKDMTDVVSGWFKQVTEVKEVEDGYKTLKDLKADDFVLVVPVKDGSNWSVSSVAVPETVTGELTNIAVKSRDQAVNGITLAGTAYKMSKLWNSEDNNLQATTTLNSKVDTTAYLDSYGYVIYAKDVTASNSAIIIDEIYSSLIDGRIVKYAQGWDSQGNEISLNIGTNPNLLSYNETTIQGRVFEYKSSTSNNAEYALVAPATTWTTGRLVYNPSVPATVTNGQYSATIADSGATTTLPFDSAAKFIFISTENDGGVGNDVTGITVKDGVSEVTAAADLTFILNKDGTKIVAVVVPNDNDAGNTANLLYVEKVTDHRNNADGKRVAIFTAWIKGEQVKGCELSKDTGNDATFQDKFYTYSYNETTKVYTLSEYQKYSGKATSVSAAGGEILTPTMLTGVADYYFNTASNGQLNARNAQVIDLYSDDGVTYGTVKEMQDAAKEKNLQFKVSYVFNDSDNTGAKTVSQLFILDTAKNLEPDVKYNVSAVANVTFSTAVDGTYTNTLANVTSGTTVYVKIASGYVLDTNTLGLTLVTGETDIYSFVIGKDVTSADLSVKLKGLESFTTENGFTIKYTTVVSGGKTYVNATMEYPKWVPTGAVISGGMLAAKINGVDAAKSVALTFVKGTTDTVSTSIGMEIDGKTVTLGESSTSGEQFVTDQVVVKYTGAGAAFVNTATSSKVLSTSATADLAVYFTTTSAVAVSFKVSGLSTADVSGTLANASAGDATLMGVAKLAKGNGFVTVDVTPASDLTVAYTITENGSLNSDVAGAIGSPVGTAKTLNLLGVAGASNDTLKIDINKVANIASGEPIAFTATVANDTDNCGYNVVLKTTAGDVDFGFVKDSSPVTKYVRLNENMDIIGLEVTPVVWLKAVLADCEVVDPYTVKIGFNQPIDPDSVAAGDITYTSGGAQPIASFEVAEDGMSMTVVVSKVLADNDTIALATINTENTNNVIHASADTITIGLAGSTYSIKGVA